MTAAEAIHALLREGLGMTSAERWRLAATALAASGLSAPTGKPLVWFENTRIFEGAFVPLKFAPGTRFEMFTGQIDTLGGPGYVHLAAYASEGVERFGLLWYHSVPDGNMRFLDAEGRVVDESTDDTVDWTVVATVVHIEGVDGDQYASPYGLRFDPETGGMMRREQVGGRA